MERNLFCMDDPAGMRSTDHSGYIHIHAAIWTPYPIFMISFHRLRSWLAAFFPRPARLKE